MCQLRRIILFGCLLVIIIFGLLELLMKMCNKGMHSEKLLQYILIVTDIEN